MAFFRLAAGNRSVLIHQLTKHQTQAPFKKQKGEVQRVAFHPSRPQFFVAVRCSSIPRQSCYSRLCLRADPTLHPDVRPARSAARQDPQPRTQVDLFARRSPSRRFVPPPLLVETPLTSSLRQPHRRFLRQASRLARPRPRLDALQDAPVPLARSPLRLLLPRLPPLPLHLGRRVNPHLPFDRLLGPPHQPAHRSSQGPEGP